MSVVPSIQRLKIFKKKHNDFGDLVGDKGKSVGEGERKSKSKRKRERERERKRERERGNVIWVKMGIVLWKNSCQK